MLLTFWVKLAVTDLAALIVTTQVPVPEQPSPLQPVNVESGSFVADNVTPVLLLKKAEQAEPQVIPAGVLVTIPLPVPLLETDNVLTIEARAVPAFTIPLPQMDGSHELPVGKVVAVFCKI